MQGWSPKPSLHHFPLSSRWSRDSGHDERNDNGKQTTIQALSSEKSIQLNSDKAR
jgi:hypothetical protein